MVYRLASLSFISAAKPSHSVRVEGLEQIDRGLEKVDHLLLRSVIGIAGGVQSADAGRVFAKLVLPKALGCPRVGRPVRVHVIQKVGLAK